MFYLLIIGVILWLLFLVSKPIRHPIHPRKLTAKGLNTRLEYDFIIVGAGSAGSPLAATLAKATDKSGKRYSVLLLEAGQECHTLPHFKSRPWWWGGWFHSETDWDYVAVPQIHGNNKLHHLARAKTTGGCSTVNGLMWVRGCKQIYDCWASAGNSGWDFKSLLPHFNSTESWAGGDGKLRGTNGPIKLSEPGRKVPIAHTFIKAAKAAGFKETPDYNGEVMAGIGFTQENTYNNLRQDVFSCYVEPLLEAKQNGSDPDLDLTVVSCALVHKVIIDTNNVATGVLVEIQDDVGSGHKVYTIKAKKEVIVSGGAFNSAQLLMLSGVGPKQHLSQFGIDVKVDNKNVGQNLHDHLSGRVVAKVPTPITVPEGSGVDCQAFYQSDWSKKNTPHKGEDMQLIFVAGQVHCGFSPMALLMKLLSMGPAHTFKGRIFRRTVKWFYHLFRVSHLGSPEGLLANESMKRVTVGLVVNQTNSRGQLLLRSANPHVHPSIDLNLCSDDADVERLVEGLERAAAIFEQQPFKDMNLVIEIPKPHILKDKQLLKDFVKQTAFAPWHPVGTCKMGVGNDAVVDPRLRVLGVKQLRVADASIMPEIVSGNTNWASIMIGVKAADLIIQDHSS